MNSADKIRAEQIRSAKESRCQAASGDLIARERNAAEHIQRCQRRSARSHVSHTVPIFDSGSETPLASGRSPANPNAPSGDNGGHVGRVVGLIPHTGAWKYLKFLV